jgi:hypothetical protein
MKDKSHMILSIDVQRVFDKIQHSFTIKKSQKINYRRNVPQYNIYDKPPVKVVLNNEKLNTYFSSKIRNRKGCLLSPLPFNVVLELQDKTIRQEK